MNLPKCHKLASLLSALCWSAPLLASGGTGIGDAGDTLHSFLNTTRFALIRTITELKINETQRTQLCPGLDEAQRAECRDFIVETLDQYLELNPTKPKVKLVVSTEPLEVIEDGKTLRADAMTPPGPLGDIYFYYPTVRLFSPFQALKLMTHEFGHKVFFRNKQIDDGPREGAFDTGRMLLDAVGEAMSEMAARNGFISDRFRLQDYFHCDVYHSGGYTPIDAWTFRSFREKGDFDHFDVQLGNPGQSLTIGHGSKDKDYELRLQVHIHEENGCRDTFRDEDRYTRLRIVKVPRTAGANRGPEPDPQVVYEKPAEPVNPVCQVGSSFRISYEDVAFDCIYQGSAGQVDQLQIK